MPNNRSASELPASQSRKSHTGDSQTSTAVSWATRYRSADDYFAFVSDALPAALKGDGRADYYIGAALQSCALVIKDYQGSSDPETQLNTELSASSKAPQWTRDLHAQRVHACIGLAKHDVFASLPAGHTYNSSYWYDLAVSRGDPLAQVRAASTVLAEIAVSTNMPADVKAQRVQSAEKSLQAAITSGDADAMFEVGIAIANSRVFSDPAQGTAIALAACELGYDCSANNPENVFADCKLSGACPADATFEYYVQQSLGGDRYAQLYARAQNIKQSVENRDWTAVAQTVKLEKASLGP